MAWKGLPLCIPMPRCVWMKSAKRLAGQSTKPHICWPMAWARPALFQTGAPRLSNLGEPSSFPRAKSPLPTASRKRASVYKLARLSDLLTYRQTPESDLDCLKICTASPPLASCRTPSEKPPQHTMVTRRALSSKRSKKIGLILSRRLHGLCRTDCLQFVTIKMPLDRFSVWQNACFCALLPVKWLRNGGFSLGRKEEPWMRPKDASKPGYPYGAAWGRRKIRLSCRTYAASLRQTMRQDSKTYRIRPPFVSGASVFVGQ